MKSPRMKSYKNALNEKKILYTKLSMTQGWNHVKNVLNEKNTIYKIMNDLKFFICAIHKTSISRRLALPGYYYYYYYKHYYPRGQTCNHVKEAPTPWFLCVTFEPWPLESRMILNRILYRFCNFWSSRF